jgi:LemA protein
MRIRRLLPLLLLLPLFFMLNGCGYNQMQRNEEIVNEAWANVQATYQRRADLIPNLVATVKGYAQHERETLEAVTAARAKVGQITLSAKDLSNPQLMAKFQQAQGELSSSLSRLMVVVERYPDLKASQNFQDLQNQLEGTENRINVARQRYNHAVQVYNTSLRVFPNNLTNRFLLHLQPKQSYTAEPGAAKAPQVKF